MGAAAYNRGSHLIRKQADQVVKSQAKGDLIAEINLLTDQRDEARDLAMERAREVAQLRDQLAAAQQQITSMEREHSAAILKIEATVAHFKTLWKEERGLALAARRRYQQLKTILLCGMKREDFDLAKGEAQAYFPWVNWEGVETMQYPNPPINGYHE